MLYFINTIRTHSWLKRQENFKDGWKHIMTASESRMWLVGNRVNKTTSLCSFRHRDAINWERSNCAELSIRFVARRTETSSFGFVKIFNENWDWARLPKLRQRNEFQRRNSFVLVSYLERISVVSFYSRYTLQSRVENFINYAALIKDFISLIQVEDKIFVFRY